MGFIRTVLGDIVPNMVGVTLAHEHTLVHWPGAEFDHRAVYNWDDVIEGLSTEFKLGKKLFNLKTLVDCTTVELGRHPNVLCEASRRSGVHVVAATGFFCESMGIPYHWRRQSVDEIAEFIVRDVTEGIVGSDVQCGIIKVASGQDDARPHPSPLGPGGRHISEHEQRIFRAAARSQKVTGCPITTHIDPEDWKVTNIGLEQLELLIEEGGNPSNISIGHTFYATIEQLLEILKYGAYVQLDNFGTGWRGLSDDDAVDLLYQVVERGYESQLLLAFDRFWYQMRGDRPYTELDPEVAMRMPLSFLPDDLLPRMRRRGISDVVIEKITVENPARFLTFARAGV